MGVQQKIQKIATLGRPNTNDFVTEYIIQYSDDGEYWRSYVDMTGEPQVFQLSYQHFLKYVFLKQ